MIRLATIGTKVVKNLRRCKPIGKAMTKISRNKPEILVFAGGALILTAFGWAIYEAITMKDTMEETSEQVKAIEAEYEVTKSRNEESSEEEKKKLERKFRKDLAVARGKGVMKVTGKFVGPAVTLAVGMGCGFRSFWVLRERNILLGTAVKGLQEAHKFYRSNVREELGEDADFRFAHGITGEKTIERIEKDKDGNEVKTSYKVPVIKDDRKLHLKEANPWRFEFSEDWFDTWQENTDTNLFYLKCTQEWWNHEFKAYKSVSMYEVLKHLHFNFDLKKKTMGDKKYKEWLYFVRNYGWTYGSGGDDFIDFGLYRAINEAAIKRQTDVVFIELNCDGPLSEGLVCENE